MAEKSTKRSQTQIDPMFFIPEGVDELIYNDEDREFSGNETEESVDDFYVTDEYSDDYFDGPATPDILGIVSQKIRTTAAGNQVVDLVVEVEDIPGLANYEFRVVKL